MSELKSYIERIFENKPSKIVISKPAKKQSEFKKITVNLMPKFYQIAKYTEKQVFHENSTADKIAERCCEITENEFLQLNAWSDEKEIYITISKKGKIFYKEKKIASVLSSLDDKIALNKKMNQKLEAMAKCLYDYWFVQYDFPDKNGHPYKTTGGPMTYNPTLKREIPAGWEVKKVSDYADLITKGTTPSTLGFDFQDTGINFVKVECIENGQILQENLMHISEGANVAMKRSQLRSNDILVTIAGRLGSAAIVSEHILPANTNQAVALIRMKKEYGHLVNYIYRVISSSSMQKRLQGSNAQSIQKNLTLPILGDIEFVQDSNCEIIKRFNEITKPIFLRQQENIQEITRLTALRDKLLPLLMNGQVVVG